ncbi:gamma-glutamylcyclotransferase [Rhodobacteraceae bacterium CCMM004]|nr:gamma-glutamylcyclotransferase [Rhodobacteraceae bacterium CCMM004]
MPLWVFGYGSLIWNPGFDVAERAIARLDGYHRAFCMWSIHHRGTEAEPGLVLALDAAEGAHCDGVAFRAAPGTEAATLEMLRARELISSAYLESRLPVTTRDGRRIETVAYVVDPVHRQYCGGLTLEAQAQVIAHAVGGRGPNTEYLYNTAAHLTELGIGDGDLEWLSRRVRDIERHAD